MNELVRVLMKGGRLDLLEVCTTADSSLSSAFERLGANYMRITIREADLSTTEGLKRLNDIVDKTQPRLTWFSTPCGPYSIQQEGNQRTPEQCSSFYYKRQYVQRIYKNCVNTVLRIIHGRIGEVVWEWRTSCKAARALRRALLRTTAQPLIRQEVVKVSWTPGA